MDGRLLAIFESQGYRLFRDESYKYDVAEERKKKWQYHELRGKLGMVYMYSDHQLAAQAYRGGRKHPASFVSKMGYKVIQDADDALVFLFQESDFKEIAKRLQLKKKRKLSPAQLKNLRKGQDGS